MALTRWIRISLRSLVFVLASGGLLGCPKQKPLPPTSTDCAGACQRLVDLKLGAGDAAACADSVSPNGVACAAWHCGDFFTVERAACESHAETCQAFNRCAGSVGP
jgi:hypothetical protein